MAEVAQVTVRTLVSTRIPRKTPKYMALVEEEESCLADQSQ